MRMPDEEEESHKFSWRASQQELADGRIRLSVCGICDHLTSVARASLTPSPAQPSNPHILLLTFSLEQTADAVTQQGLEAIVRYEQTSNNRYKLISIQPGGVGVAVTDEHISGSEAPVPD